MQAVAMVPAINLYRLSAPPSPLDPGVRVFQPQKLRQMQQGAVKYENGKTAAGAGTPC